MGIGAGNAVELDLQRRVRGLRLAVDGLQLLPAGFKLPGRPAILPVDGSQLPVGGSQLTGGGAELLPRDPQLTARGLKLLPAETPDKLPLGSRPAALARGHLAWRQTLQSFAIPIRSRERSQPVSKLEMATTPARSVEFPQLNCPSYSVRRWNRAAEVA